MLKIKQAAKAARAGQVISGRAEAARKIGHDVMSVVYEAA